jgi:Mg-chelatase subunit ChlD
MMREQSRLPGSAPLRALALAGVLILSASATRALARPDSPTQANTGNGYALSATWSNVGAARRVVAGVDGHIYVLSDLGILQVQADGTVVRTVTPSAPVLRELAVDGTGNLFGASGSEVRRVGADGRTGWSAPVTSEQPSPLVPYPVQPYIAGLAWNGGAGVTLLYDSYDVMVHNYSRLRSHAIGNGLDVGAPEFIFPTHSYWDIDYHAGRLYALNRTPLELRPTPQVELYEGLTVSNQPPVPLPAPAERIAVDLSGDIFAVSDGRWIYHVDSDANGAILDSWDARGTKPGAGSRVMDVAVDAEGRVYVADPSQAAVRVYTRQQGVTNPLPPNAGSGGGELGACQMLPNKWADPTYLRLGEPTQVTLTLGGNCPLVAEQADIVLVVDQSNSMSYENGSKMVGAKAAVKTFVDGLDTTRHRLGLVAFGSYAQRKVALTHDKQQVLNQVAQLEPLGGREGGTEIAAGLNAGVDELEQNGLKDGKTRHIILLMTDGVAFNSTRLTTVAAGDRARAAGVTVFSIGFGADVEPDLLRLVATSPDMYDFAPDSATLKEIYERLGRAISAMFLLKEVVIVDTIPGNMKFRPDLPADPVPDYDPVAHTLTWHFSPVSFAGITMKYWLEPLEVGTWPTNVQAIYTGKDGLDRPQTGPFPIPQVIVWAPTVTPTITHTALPTPSATATATHTRTATGTATSSPTRTRPPTATATGTRLPPTLTPTRRPSPTRTLTRTSTATPPPTDTATPGPTPTATPTGYTIYLTVMFNDRCFKRYTDSILVIDASTTMLKPGDDGRSKLEAAKAAARRFIAVMEFTPDATGRHDQVGLVWFNDTAVVQQGLTNDRALLDAALDAIDPVQGSRLDLGLLAAHTELIMSDYRVLANNPVVVFLSDGIPNRTTVDEVIHQADSAKLDAIAVYTVGFGDDVRDDVMRRVASQPEMYRRSTGNRDLERIYEEIAGDVVCR